MDDAARIGAAAAALALLWAMKPKERPSPEKRFWKQYKDRRTFEFPDYPVTPFAPFGYSQNGNLAGAGGCVESVSLGGVGGGMVGHGCIGSWVDVMDQFDPSAPSVYECESGWCFDAFAERVTSNSGITGSRVLVTGTSDGYIPGDHIFHFRKPSGESIAFTPEGGFFGWEDGVFTGLYTGVIAAGWGVVCSKEYAGGFPIVTLTGCWVCQ